MTAFPLRFGIDHERKRVSIRAIGDDGKEVHTTVALEEISKLIAVLSQCQHALVHSLAGEKISLPLDLETVFPKAGGFALGAHEGLARFSAGVDTADGTVALIVWSSMHRISGYRMPPDMARYLGEALLKSADEVPAPQKAS